MGSIHIIWLFAGIVGAGVTFGGGAAGWAICAGAIVGGAGAIGVGNVTVAVCVGGTGFLHRYHSAISAPSFQDASARRRGELRLWDLL